MTEPVEAGTADVEVPETMPELDPIVAYVLRVRATPAGRSALRRGLSPATSHHTDPYLARFWANTPWLRDPLVCFAALAATFDGIDHKPTMSPGRVTAAVAEAVFGPGGDDGPAPVELEVGVLQGQGLDMLRRFLQRVLAAAHQPGSGVDWQAVWQLCRGWDHPNLDIRRRNRRRLIEQLYAAPPSPNPTTDPLDQQGTLR